MVTTEDQLSEIVDECQDVMAHAWMVRTFVKHSEEVEDFSPVDGGRAGCVRHVTCTGDAAAGPGWLHQDARQENRPDAAATEQFRGDAPLASTHTNFVQAVRSIDLCVTRLEQLLVAGRTFSRPKSPSRRPDCGDILPRLGTGRHASSEMIRCGRSR
ncbi:MAG: hypothetical protein Ct9H300mP1_00560 [Planctomycetaceae bacterium]|nr:MAG: hypothetical protein Ct9H300mP1_00560 [Planctomycetaceae bacterium]